MGRWWTLKWAKIAGACTVLILAAVFIGLNSSQGVDEAQKWAVVLGLFVSIGSLLLSIAQAGKPKDADFDLTQLRDRATEKLAEAVGEQWRTEERLRGVSDSGRLPVRWTAANPEVTDDWVNIRRQSTQRGALALDGQLEQVVNVFTRVSSGRLVVLGGRGSGKTVLTLRFTLDLLDRRQPGDRVPVIFSLSSWHPENQVLREWIYERLATDYPALSALAPSGFTWARVLFEAGRILPVLDGFDEIQKPLRGKAMRRLNEALNDGDPVVLTCRTSDYEETVATAEWLTSAAAVELQPLSLEDLAAYLPYTAGNKVRAAKWELILAFLREHPDQALAKVLSTPLMASMACATYRASDADPIELLDDRFIDPATLEGHLLNAIIRVRFAGTSRQEPRPVGVTPKRQWDDPRLARGWLAFLATHLDSLRTPNMAWWQLHQAIPALARPRPRAILIGLLVGVTFGPLFGIMYGLAYGAEGGLVHGLDHGLALGVATGIMSLLSSSSDTTQVNPRSRRRGRPLTRIFTIGLATGAAYGFTYDLTYDLIHGSLTGLTVGFIYGAEVGLANGFAFGLTGEIATPSHPRRAHVRLRGRGRELARILIKGLVAGVSCGFVAGVAEELVVRLIVGSDATFKTRIVVGMGPALVFGIGFGLIFGLIRWVQTPIESREAASPSSTLRIDRTFVVFRAALLGLVVTAMFSLAAMIGIKGGIRVGFEKGFEGGLAALIVVGLSGAWPFYLIASTWLALRGRLPWHLMTFLEDAHRLGILRQNGPYYQFSHERLHENLASHRASRQPDFSRGADQSGDEAEDDGL